jgi:Glycosyl hydrolases family 28
MAKEIIFRASPVNKYKHMRLYIYICFLILSIRVCAAASTFNIADFGARNDGITLNTVAIQRAIDAAHQAGGGVVFVPRGRFLCGVIHLKSKVRLHLHEEAVLLASTDRAHYGPSMQASPWILTEDAQQVAITGGGLIDGQCDLLIQDIYAKLRAGTLQDPEWKRFNPWHQRRPSERNRPRMIEFRRCDSVTVSGVRMQNGTSWIQDYRECTRVLIEGIDVLSNTFLNNDGIDLTDCKDAVVRNCRVNAADDGICLKSSNRTIGCENILVENCSVRSSASAIKLGTASHGGFRNITVRNIRIHDTYRSAVAIESVDGGNVENVHVSDIRAINTGNAFFIRLGHRNTDSVQGRMRGITIRDMRVEVPRGKPDRGYFMEGPELLIASGDDPERIHPGTGLPIWHHYGIDTNAAKYPHNVFPSSVTGIPGHPVQDLVLEDIEIIYEGGSERTTNEIAPDEAGQRIPEAVSAYPEFSMFGELPAWGMFSRHVEGLRIRDVRMHSKDPDHRMPLLFMDTKNFIMKDMRINGKRIMSRQLESPAPDQYRLQN